VPSGVGEEEVIREVAIALARAGTRPLVLLAAGDDRLLRYRHPLPSSLVWHDRLMVAVCAERGGLVVALSRLLAARPPDAEIARRLAAAQSVLAAMLDASVAGTSAARIFQVAAAAYAAQGFPGEEARHHQGGAIGYRSREWIAHPQSPDVVASPTALAWNPSVTGTKVEETCLVTGAGYNIHDVAGSAKPASAEQEHRRTIHPPDHFVSRDLNGRTLLESNQDITDMTKQLRGRRSLPGAGARPAAGLSACRAGA
jgi:hypothetical protein